MPKIDFIMQNIPDNAYKKDEDSNLYKILSSISTELDGFINDIEKVRNAKFIEYAQGDDLDKLGSLLNTPRFVNENDNTYRGRIKAKVPSFIGGGTIESIRQVIKGLLNVEPTIIEHYKPGEGHIYFDNGILKGIEIKKENSRLIKITQGTFYVEGIRYSLPEKEVSLSGYPTGIKFNLVMNTSGSIMLISGSINPQYIPLAEIELTEDDVEIIDSRNILNPEEHFITNIATITIQIPYDFSTNNISFEDTKNIIKNTKAAGIAVLMRVVGLYQEAIGIKENKMHFDFLCGFSGIGSDSFIGGQING